MSERNTSRRTCRSIRTGVSRRRRARFATILLVCLVAITPTAGAESAGEVRWAVQPGTADGPDDRRTMAFTLDPGQSAQDHVVVRNLGDSEVTFTLAANDGYLTASGSFDMRPSSHVPADGGSWIEVADAVTVPAGGSAVVPISIEVPAEATPGDHPAGVAASIQSAGDGMVATEHRVGVRVDIRVTGTAQADAALHDVAARPVVVWSPLEPGGMDVSAALVNTGNVRLRSDLDVTVSGPLATTRSTRIASGDVGNPGDVIPGGGKPFEARIDSVWAIGPVTTTITMTPLVVGEASGAGTQAEADPVTVSVTTWVIPWPQILLAALLGFLVYLLTRERTRRRRALAAQLAAAKRSGAEEALVRAANAQPTDPPSS